MQRLRSAARAVTQIYETKLSEVDLTAGQFSTLIAIARQEGVTVSTLAERLGMDRTTVTRALAPLERRQIVRIGTSPEDSRAKAVFLKHEGRELLNKAIPIWNEAQARVTANLDDGQWDVLKEDISRLTT